MCIFIISLNYEFLYVLFLLRHTYPTRYVLGNGTYNIKRMKHRNIDFSVVRFHSFTRNRIVLISLPLVFFSFLILSHEKAVTDPSNFCLLYCQPATGENIFDKIRSLKQASLTKKKNVWLSWVLLWRQTKNLLLNAKGYWVQRGYKLKQK